jgi:hypothetical protein
MLAVYPPPLGVYKARVRRPGRNRACVFGTLSPRAENSLPLIRLFATYLESQRCEISNGTRLESHRCKKIGGYPSPSALFVPFGRFGWLTPPAGKGYLQDEVPTPTKSNRGDKSLLTSSPLESTLPGKWGGGTLLRKGSVSARAGGNNSEQ